MSREQLQNLTEPMYYLLLAMLTPRHGYDAMQYIQTVTKGRVKIGAGTMYALLSRFEKEKILVQTAEEGRRKIYQLTPKGRELLNEETRRLCQLLADTEIMQKEARSHETL
ncbi:MAG: PadR family transcriptional regulator [Candidatus Merdivicinus sp.]|jgi:DNA-binding PadR family transcriptional regulator